MSASDYLESKLLDHALGVAAFPMPTTLFMSLHTADPGETGIGSEVTGGSYARQAITFTANVAGSPSPSGIGVTFINLPAVTVTHFVIRDALASGNALFIGPLTTPQTMVVGQALTFNAGQLTVAAN